MWILKREGSKSQDITTQSLEWLTFDDKWIKIKILSADEDVSQLTLSYMAGGEKKVHSLWKTSWQYHIKSNMQLPGDPRILLLLIYSREIYTKILSQCSQQFYLYDIKKYPKGLLIPVMSSYPNKIKLKKKEISEH